MWLRTVVALSWLCTMVLGTPSLTALDHYVQHDDGCYHFEELLWNCSGPGWKGFAWNLTSQCWQPADVVNRGVWWHVLTVVIPDKFVRHVAPDPTALLYIAGHNNDGDPIPSANSSDVSLISRLAVEANVPAALLFQVPNQPLNFSWDPWHRAHRTEDAAIAITWWRFLQNQTDPSIVLEFPMTKAAVKALDALQEILPMYIGVPVSKFVIAGESKRGWTTWLTGAVESVFRKRARAIVPIVLSAIHVREFLHRQFEFFGAWSFELGNHYKDNITQSIDDPPFELMMENIDPWYYRERLVMPKLCISAVGDEYQMPDDQKHWAHDLPGETNLLMVKNADHGLSTGLPIVLQSFGSFLSSVAAGGRRPNYTWKINETSGELHITTDKPPSKVTIAYGDSAPGPEAQRRDFRWASLATGYRPLYWSTTPITFNTTNSLIVKLPAPHVSWAGMIVEMQWPNSHGPDFYLTSPGLVVPGTRPFPPCKGADCKGTLC
jgi:PhoPQ-activated pathogenicity-related protein